jgi:transposase
MTHGRTHTRDFKLMVAREIMRGERRPSQVCREHGLDHTMVLRWRREVETRGDDAFLPLVAREDQTKDLRIAELERLCGQLALENAALKKGLSALTSRSGTR